jgi:hypothetical protein
MSDLFGAGGRQLLAAARLAPGIASPRRLPTTLIEALDFEIEMFATLPHAPAREHPGYRALLQIPGVGPVLAAIFVAEIAEIGGIGRFARLAGRAGVLGRAHPDNITSSTPPPYTAAGSPNRAAGWSGGPRSRPSSKCPRTPASGRSATTSLPAAAALALHVLSRVEDSDCRKCLLTR